MCDQTIVLPLEADSGNRIFCFFAVLLTSGGRSVFPCRYVSCNQAFLPGGWWGKPCRGADDGASGCLWLTADLATNGRDTKA